LVHTKSEKQGKAGCRRHEKKKMGLNRGSQHRRRRIGGEDKRGKKNRRGMGCVTKSFDISERRREKKEVPLLRNHRKGRKSKRSRKRGRRNEKPSPRTKKRRTG